MWFGLLGAPLAWTGQHLLGFGFFEGLCNSGGVLWGINPRAWEIVLTAVAGAVALAAEAAAFAVWRDTGAPAAEAPASGRIHFFAAGSLAVGVIFLALILMNGLGAAYHAGCQQG
jgi:hypothetical protein